MSQWAWSCVDESQSSITNYYTSEFLPSKEFPLSGQCVSTHKHSHPSTCAVVKQDMKWQNEMKQRKELKQDVTIKTLTMTSQDGGQVVKALDYRPRGPRFQPHYNNRDFFSPRSLLALPKKVRRCILKVFSLGSLYLILQRGCKVVGPG